MPLGAHLLDAGEPINRIYFPLEGVISIVSVYDDGDMTELATIGREGFSSVNALLGGKTTPARLLVQAEGASLAIPRAEFDRLVRSEPSFRSSLGRYAEAFLFQLMTSASCNGAHSAEQRLARWLLTMFDRSAGAPVRLTQESLADLLNVRRATVSEGLRRLRRLGALKGGRARIEIANRAKLTAASCPCYRAVREYRRDVMGTDF